MGELKLHFSGSVCAQEKGRGRFAEVFGTLGTRGWGGEPRAGSRAHRCIHTSQTASPWALAASSLFLFSLSFMALALLVGHLGHLGPDCNGSHGSDGTEPHPQTASRPPVTLGIAHPCASMTQPLWCHLGGEKNKLENAK